MRPEEPRRSESLVTSQAELKQISGKTQGEVIFTVPFRQAVDVYANNPNGVAAVGARVRIFSVSDQVVALVGEGVILSGQSRVAVARQSGGESLEVRVDNDDGTVPQIDPAAGDQSVRMSLAAWDYGDCCGLGAWLTPFQIVGAIGPTVVPGIITRIVASGNPVATVTINGVTYPAAGLVIEPPWGSLVSPTVSTFGATVTLRLERTT